MTRILKIIGISLALMMAFCALAAGEKVLTLQWDPSIDEPYLQSYRVYHRSPMPRPDSYVVQNTFVRPTGHTEGDWTDEANAYDTATNTYAATSTQATAIELTTPETPCNAVRINALSETGGEVPSAKIELYYSGEYHTLHDGSIPNTSSYNEYALGSTQTVTAARVTLGSDATTRPTGHTEGDWADEAYAYDTDTATYASTTTAATSIELTIPATLANQIKIWATDTAGGDVDSATVEVLYAGVYQSIQTAGTLTYAAYKTLNIGSAQTITGIKITLVSSDGIKLKDVQAVLDVSGMRLYDFQFMAIDTPVVVVPIGEDPGYIEICKDNTEVELHYNADGTPSGCYYVTAVDTRGLESVKTNNLCPKGGRLYLGGGHTVKITGTGGGVLHLKNIP